MQGALWIADADPAARQEVGWALRDRFAAVVELDGEAALTAEMERAGPVERLVDGCGDQVGQWRSLLLIVGERRTITLVFRDPVWLERIRRST